MPFRHIHLALHRERRGGELVEPRLEKEDAQLVAHAIHLVEGRLRDLCFVVERGGRRRAPSLS